MRFADANVLLFAANGLQKREIAPARGEQALELASLLLPLILPAEDHERVWAIAALSPHRIVRELATEHRYLRATKPVDQRRVAVQQLISRHPGDRIARLDDLLHQLGQPLEHEPGSRRWRCVLPHRLKLHPLTECCQVLLNELVMEHKHTILTEDDRLDQGTHIKDVSI